MKTIPIIIPLHHKGGKHGDNTELRFCLRSLEQHFKGLLEVVIVGRKLPEWITGVRHIYGEGLKSSLHAAAKEYPDGFFWVYDDFCLLRDTAPAQMKITPACKGWGAAKTKWARMLESIRSRLVREGRPAHDYSRPHGPYFFDIAMVEEGFSDWPKMGGKFPWETWILSKRDWPRCHGAVKQYYGAFRGSPPSSARYLNHNDRGNTPELREWLRKRFPDRSKFETNDEMSKEQVYKLQARHLEKAWNAAGSPPLRTICECAVGPWSLLAPYEGKCDRAIFIEPDPAMARNARRNYPWAEVHEVAIAENFGTANLRKLNGASYIKGIAWAPAFSACPSRAKKAGKVSVQTVPFSDLDDGKIDMLNLDCEGSEWFVLKAMTSRPRFLQIELYSAHGHYREICEWLKSNGYTAATRWGNANLIYVRNSNLDYPAQFTKDSPKQALES
jgi:FkbM family methyltransferase